MAKPFYKQNQAAFKKTAKQFSSMHPAIAGQLAGPARDPDVELTTMANIFNNSMLYEMDAAESPVLIDDFSTLTAPHLSQTIPGCATVAFQLKPDCSRIELVHAGAQVRSVDINDDYCLFTIKNDTEIHPLTLKHAAFIREKKVGSEQKIRFLMAFSGNTNLSRWHPRKGLRIFLRDPELWLILDKHLTCIRLTPVDGGESIELAPTCLTQPGFNDDEAILTYPAPDSPAYRLLSEFFNFPEKFYTVLLTGWDKWENRGTGTTFTIDFILDNTYAPSVLPKIKTENIVFNTAIAVNEFSHKIDPILLDNRKERYKLRPTASDPDNYQIVHIDSVTGFRRETREERSYLPFDLFADNSTAPLYNVTRKKSQHGDATDVWISVIFQGAIPKAYSETLSIEATCINSNALIEHLRIGDINIPVSGIPQGVTVRNITHVTHSQQPKSRQERRHELNTQLILNNHSLDTENFRTQLKLMVSHDDRPGSPAEANLKRIDGIQSLQVTPGKQPVDGIVMRGKEINIKISRNHFAGAADCHLFCHVIDHFFAWSAATNAYTRITVHETSRGIITQWPMRLDNCTQKSLVFTPGPFPADMPTHLPPVAADTSSSWPEPDTRPDILADLIANGPEFDFFQVMHLAQKIFTHDSRQEESEDAYYRLIYDDLQPEDAQEEQSEDAWLKRIQVTGDSSLTFPASDISGIKQGPDNKLQITATFGSLYGVSSPMPNHYSDAIISEAVEDDSSVTRHFLDIYNRGFYIFWYLIKCAHRLCIKISEEKSPLYLQRLFSLIGMAEKTVLDSVPEAFQHLRRTALLNKSIRTGVGLQTLLRDAFGIGCITVEQCVQRKVPIPDDQRMRLGMANCILGVNSVVGSTILSRSGKFRVHIGPLNKKDFDKFLPGGPNHLKLIRLIRMHEINPFQYDLNLILAAGQVRQIRLGDPNGPRVGLDAWCFDSYTLGQLNSIYQLSEWPLEPLPEEDEWRHTTEPEEPKTLVDYYQESRGGLDDNIDDFVEIYPDTAPMVSGHMTDPDVERLTQSTALNNAMLLQNMDNDTPEIIHPVTEGTHPWDLREIPSMSIVAFTPRPELKESALIRAGAEVASIPVPVTECRFRTCFDVTVHPMTLLAASFIQPPGKGPSIRLQCELNGIPLSAWKPNPLRFFLGDDYPAACNLFLLLLRYLKHIVITSLDSGACILIPADCLKPAGFGDNETMLTKQKSLMPGHLILQEYFLFKDKYLFLELTGMDNCKHLGSGSRFEISFELKTALPFAPQVNERSFVLSATPVVNLFGHKAKPLMLTDDEQLQIHPISNKPTDISIYSVDRISEFDMDAVDKKRFTIHTPLTRHSDADYICRITCSKSPLQDGFDTFLSVSRHKQSHKLSNTELDIDLTCTNGALAEQLNIGDICIRTSTTPESTELRNIRPVTSAISPDNSHNRQWRLLSSFLLNANTSLNIAKNLRSIMRLFISTNSRNQALYRANMERVDSIESISAKPVDRLIDGCMHRGYDITVRLRDNSFEGLGNLFMFGSILECFLGCYVTQHCFVRLAVEELGKGHRFEWPARFGDRHVL